MRLGIDSLAYLTKSQFNLAPFSGHLHSLIFLISLA
ncbi:hypothetical protein HO831_02930 [Streptococcus suis]|nr:transposase [Streptococcus suis]UTI56681.1 transposase [Streptococcus suis T15]HEM3220613.1 hypothetical protein [Streptococcus suis 2651]HEM3236095.1 hypothetical protein [Streptococcus suis 14636]MBS8077118.1 transposase [Streptococcus suis]